MKIDCIENNDNVVIQKSGIISLAKLYKMLELENASDCIDVKSNAGILYRKISKEIADTIPSQKRILSLGKF